MSCLRIRSALENSVASHRNGAEFSRIARSLNMSVGTAFTVFKIFKDTGDVEPKHMEYHGFSVTERVAATILAIVFENSTLYLNEMTQKIFEYANERISPSTVCIVMHKHGIHVTRKKIQRIALQRSSTPIVELIWQICLCIHCVSQTCWSL
jgi:hypothetical protein